MQESGNSSIDPFKFQRNSSKNSSGSSTKSNGHEQCRKRLKDKFDVEVEESKNGELDRTERTVFGNINLNDTRKYIRNGAERISKTFNTMRVTFGTISQRFKTVTRRRQILEEGPMTPNVQQTPHTRSRQVLGRTPTKLYSPFGIDSPYHPTTINKENIVPVSEGLVKISSE